MRIGILGSVLMGGKPGTHFARAGHEVVFNSARSTEKLQRLARDAGGKARAGTPRPFCLLVAQLAYWGTGGPELAYRFRFRE
jgi:hypothetical protein